jgi:acetoin utilization protein AcuB
MRISEIMNKDVVATSPREEADRAWSEMRLRRCRHLVVMERKRVVGIISDRDLGGSQGTSVRRGRTVGDLMTRQIVTADSETTIRQAANLMRSRAIGCLPVVEGERLVGIVTTADILEQLGGGTTRPTVRAERRMRRAPATHQRGGTARTRVHSRPARNAGRKRASATRAR